MHRGYIKLWRKSLESPMWKNHTLSRFWIWCLLKASHADHTETVGFQSVELKSGEFVFGRKVAAKETGLSEQNIRTALLWLKSHQQLTITATNKFSIIRIENWDLYQESNQQINQPVTSKQPATNQQLTTNKNDKNDNNDKKIYISLPDFTGVKLTQEEYNKLQQQFGDRLNDKLNALSLYLQSTGKKYKSHYATILNWARRDGNGKQPGRIPPKYTDPAELEVE